MGLINRKEIGELQRCLTIRAYIATYPKDNPANNIADLGEELYTRLAKVTAVTVIRPINTPVMEFRIALLYPPNQWAT